MRLGPSDRQRLTDFYRRSFRSSSQSSKRVHWSEREGQITRFRVLASIGDLRKTSVLDAGCGLGDLYDYLGKEVGDVDYSGIDIVPDFIKEAKKRFPETEFLKADIMEYFPNRTFDYVLCSGGLSFKVEDNGDFYRSFIKKMFSLCNIGIGFNMLDRKFHVDDETYAAYDPVEISDFCRGFSDNVQIITDYLIEDFTIFAYR